MVFLCNILNFLICVCYTGTCHPLLVTFELINLVFFLACMWLCAASLGQVYKGRLKENGDLVAVKVQRPFVLETVTVDLFVIRNLGLVLRRFPQVRTVGLCFCCHFPCFV